MIANARRLLIAPAGATASLSLLLIAACAPRYATAPEQIQASNPTTAYRYHTDQELLQVNRAASNFCTQYHAVPRPASFAASPDGGRIVQFECVPAATQVVQQAPVGPNLTYTDRTDQQLLDASRSAQAYCINNGSQQAVSNIITNADGTRTVVFQCSRP